jgi:hypothetical protein
MSESFRRPSAARAAVCVMLLVLAGLAAAACGSPTGPREGGLEGRAGGRAASRGRTSAMRDTTLSGTVPSQQGDAPLGPVLPWW